MKPSFQRSLLDWYHSHKRDLPWRRSRDPYHILVSEIMLQQTQVDTVIPYYQRFLKSFPSFKKLASAPVEKVLKHWEGLGYYSRARNLHALAKAVENDHGGQLPAVRETLHDLPGIGPYTVGAILSIAFAKDHAVLDGNVERVLARFFGWKHDLRTTAARKEIWKIAESLVPKGKAGDYNQAVMELGALICTPRLPKCPECPVALGCVARKRDLIDRIPYKREKRSSPHYQIGAGVIWDGNKILIGQRPYAGLLGGLWEFPGGKQEPGESMAACVEREIKEELNVRVSAKNRLTKVDHAYSHFKITLHVYTCRYSSGKPQAIGCRAWKWVRPKDLRKYAFPAANQPVIDLIINSKKDPKIV